MADKQKGAATNYGINLADGISGPAARAAKALDDLRKSMRSDTDELAAMERAMRNLKKGGAEFEAQAASIAVQVKAKRKAIADTQLEYLKLGGAYARPIKPPKPPKPPKVDPPDMSAFTQVLGELRQGLEQSQTGLGRFASGLTRVLGRMSGVKIVAVALAAAFVAVAGAAALATRKLFDSAIAAQDARRSELLHLEALTRRRHMYSRTANSATDMQAAIDRISASVSISRGEVAQLAAQLDTSGVRGARFDQILEASAIQASALGSAAGSAFAGFGAAVGVAGGSVTRLTQDVKNRFGGIVADKMKSLDVQALKLKENFDSMFGGLDISGFLDAKKGLNDMLSQTTASGRALKSLMTTVLQPLLDAATDGIVIVRRFFKQMLLGALQIQGAYLLCKLYFVQAFGGSGESKSTLTKWLDRMQLGRVFTYLLAAAIGVLAFKAMVGLTLAIARASSAMWLFALRSMGRFIFIVIRAAAAMVPLLVRLGIMAVEMLIATWPVWAAVAAFAALVGIFYVLIDAFQRVDWAELGDSIWRGIVDGLKRGWTAIKNAAGELANKLKSAFANALKISSPSKVFENLGYEIPEGVRVGIERRADAANEAAAGIVSPTTPRIPAAGLGTGGPAPAAAVTRGAVTVSIGKIEITAGGDAPKDMAVALRRELESVLAGLAEQLGADREATA